MTQEAELGEVLDDVVGLLDVDETIDGVDRSSDGTDGGDTGIRATPETVKRNARFPLATWIVAVIIVVASPVLSIALISQQEPLRAAEAEVLAVSGQSATTAIQVETAVRTEQVILESRAVVLPAAAGLGISVEELEDHVEVSIVGESLALRVRAEHESAETALDYVQATVAEYIRVNTSSDLLARQSLLRATIETLTDERITIEDRLTQLEVETAGADLLDLSGRPAEIRRLQSESQQLLERIGALETEVLNLDLELVDAEQPIVVSEPYVLVDPVAADRVQAMAFGLFLGLTIAALLLAGRYQIRAMGTSSTAGAERRAHP